MTRDERMIRALARKLKVDAVVCRSVLLKHSEQVLGDKPLAGFTYQDGDRAVRAAVQLEVIDRIQEVLEARGRRTMKAHRKALLGAMHGNLIHGARFPARNCSPLANLVAQTETEFFADYWAVLR